MHLPVSLLPFHRTLPALHHLLPSEGDSKADPGIPVVLETLHAGRMQGRCPRAGVDLRTHGRDAQLRETDMLTSRSG